jgi:hypothetical protein
MVISGAVSMLKFLLEGDALGAELIGPLDLIGLPADHRRPRLAGLLG